MEEVIAGGGKVDEIPPERTFVVTVLLGRELMTEEHTVSRSRAVTRQGEVPGEAAWWVDIGRSIDSESASWWAEPETLLTTSLYVSFIFVIGVIR